MDSLISAAARALAAGEPLSALDLVALREDPPALALRGIAMAQLEDFETATQLLLRAQRAFAPGEATARARCTVALAEVAYAAREPGPRAAGMRTAIAQLMKRGDHDNALRGHLVLVRSALLFGRLGDADSALHAMQVEGLLATARADILAHMELARAQLALRRTEGRAARAALTRARDHAIRSRISALVLEIEAAFELLEAPAARLLQAGEARSVSLEEVEELLASSKLVIDGCRLRLSQGGTAVELKRRPVLFELSAVLGRHAALETPRETLMREVFGARAPNDSHRARLRVEIGRLRAALQDLVQVETTESGYRLASEDIVLLVPPVEGSAAQLQALLADGERWSTSMLALACGASQRTVQRALAKLHAEGRVRALGQGRSRRWVASPARPFATPLLLANLTLEG